MLMRIRSQLSRLTGGLTFRLLVLITMTLAPLGAISISTSNDMQRAAQAAAERSLIGLTADAVAGERALIESALGSARSLQGFLLERRDDAAACSALLRDYVERSTIYSFAGFIDLEGEMDCLSEGEAVRFGERETFQRLRASPMTTVAAPMTGEVTGLPVIIVTHPIRDDGVLAGFLAISITRATLEAMARRQIADTPRNVVLINHLGEVLNRQPDDPMLELLPQEETLVELATARGDRVLSERTQDGARVVLSKAELIPGRLYALAVWDKTSPAVAALDVNVMPLLFPAAMWLACLAVLMLAVHYLVLRHLKALNRQVRAFALGRREDWIDMHGHAPAEIRTLGTTFRNMARLIAREESEREQALAEKTVLLKEIHHRVKNNLQLIASVINLQLRELNDPEAHRVLLSVQHRVLGLASVHRALYAEDRLSRVRADRVIEELLSRIAEMATGPGRAPKLRLTLEPMTLDADQMVPLSFLLHEAVTNALKHLGAENAGAAWIAVDLGRLPTSEAQADHADGTRGEDTVTLRVRNPMVTRSDADRQGDVNTATDTGADAEPGLGAELIEAFAMQLGGTCRQGALHDAESGTVWELELSFPAPIERPDDPAAAPAS